MILRKIARRLGSELIAWSSGDPATGLTMKSALMRCAKRGTKVNTVIDVGASNGSWTALALPAFPKAKYILIEAQEAHKPSLQSFCAGHPNCQFVIAAAGKNKGKIYFDNRDLFGGLASEEPLATAHIEVPVISIDEELKERALQGPYLLKLDTHGFELPILEGASETIKKASLIIIESYNFQLTANSLRFFEMCNYMKSLGFLPVELVDFMSRGKDGAFWQMDIFFISETDAVFASDSYE